MNIQKNISLKPFNTFGIQSIAKKWYVLDNLSNLSLLSPEIKESDNYLILGGGSNILLTGDYNGLIIHNKLSGIEKIKEDEDHVWIKSMAGEVWHDFVIYCVDHGYGGIENLSLIPGFVGAAPMQNIGAYGVELNDVFEMLEAYHIEKQEVHLFDNDDCQFEYRNSIFKNQLKSPYIILSVTLKLSKNGDVNTSYGAIQDTLRKMNVTEPTIKDVSQAIIAIRTSKLPDPKVIGNSGSFFKNPVVNNEQVEKIKIDFPNMPSYKVNDSLTKIPAGWLIEQCGWKGKVVGNTGTYKNQALVIVNHGNATGMEILDLSKEIHSSVKSKFGIQLTAEVNII